MYFLLLELAKSNNKRLTPKGTHMNTIKRLMLVAMLMSVVAGVQAQDVASLVISESQLESCKPKSVSGFSEVRTALAQLRYADAAEALNLLDSQTDKNNIEYRYLLGKIHYLLAYEKVNNRIAVAADAQHLSLARENIEWAAKEGFAEAIYDQAVLLVPPNEENKKHQLLKLAAEKKFIAAMLMLAEIKFLSAKTFEDRIEAQSLVLQAANVDSDAKIRIASYYLHENALLNNATGYDKNVNKAIQFLYSAVTKCNETAAYKLYKISISEHKPNDLPAERALYWLEVAAKLNSITAQGDLADYYNSKGNSDKATHWALQAAKHQNLKGILTLGKIYYKGAGGDKDLPRALNYYEQAYLIDKNNRLVQNQLGIMYYRGEGAEVNFRRAADMCKRAANKGQAGCQYYLGLMYVNGEGVTQDIDTGIGWMKKSAAQDYSTAKNWLRENW